MQTSPSSERNHLLISRCGNDGTSLLIKFELNGLNLNGKLDIVFLQNIDLENSWFGNQPNGSNLINICATTH